MLRPTASLLKQLSEATKNRKSKSEAIADQALAAKYASMSPEELEAEFDTKMSEPSPPIVIGGKNIRDMDCEELAIVYSEVMRQYL